MKADLILRRIAVALPISTFVGMLIFGTLQARLDSQLAEAVASQNLREVNNALSSGANPCMTLPTADVNHMVGWPSQKVARHLTFKTFISAAWKCFFGADRTPLFTAVVMGRDIRITQAFVSHGADVNTKISNGCTALDLSIEYGEPKTVLYLLHSGARPSGDSFIRLLVFRQKTGTCERFEVMRIARALVNAGADVNGVSSPIYISGQASWLNGKTALQIVERYGSQDPFALHISNQDELIEFIKSHGGR